MACNPCTTSTNPCTNCDDALLSATTFCNDGCAEIVNTECVEYSGTPIVTTGLTINTGDNLNSVIGQLATNALTVTLSLTWNNTTRQLCLIQNGSAVSCVTIPTS